MYRDQHQPYFIRPSLLLSLLFMIGSFISPETSVAQKYYTAETSFAVKLGRTKPLYEVVSLDPTDSTKLKSRKANKPVYVPNFAGRRHLEFHSPDALPKGYDPLFNENQWRTPLNKIEPKVIIEGINQNNVTSGVPDVNGDISRDYFVEIVNATHFRVYNKTGQAVSNLISANSIWGQVQQSSAGDPILLYDQEADRWFLTEFPSNNRVLLAISVTNDPRGSWDAYAFQTPRFPDFPKYGIWPDAYYLSTNENGSSFPIYAFNREDLLAGVDMVRFQRMTVPKHGGVFFEVGQPVDWDGMTRPPEGSPGLIVKMHDDDWETTDEDHIMLHKVHIDWDTASNSNIEIIEIPTAPFDSDGCSLENTGGFSCIPQPNSQGIDGAEWIVTNKAQYRNFGTHESFVLSFMVDITGDEVAGIRWMEFRKTATEDWHIYQEGTVGSTDGLHRFMSSIGIDGQGNIGLAYSVSGYNKHPSLRFTGRFASDPLGEMTFEEYEFASGSGSIGQDRFGDYASMSVDPADDKTFWFAGEYIRANGSWGTKIVAFEASKDTFDIFPVSLISPQNNPALSDNELITVNVINRGINTVYGFKVGYQFMSGAWVEEDALIDSLLPDSFYVHTFQTGVNFTSPGNYTLRIASDMDVDQNRLNDTVDFMITKLAFRDVALQFDATGQQDIVCSESSDNNIILRNMGADVVEHLLLEVILNNTPVDTFLWTGAINSLDEEVITLPVNGLLEGLNEIKVNILTVNQLPDEIPSNNFIEWTLTAKPSGEALLFQLTTDNFPQETTWQLTDSANNIIMQDGPYSESQHLYTTHLCLDPDACYTLTLFDGFGDGIGAQGIEGDYELFNSEGEVIASLADPEFGSSDVNQFCVTGKCLFTVTVGVEHESSTGAGDAWAIADVSNPLGEVLYSIDGGITFQPENAFLQLTSGSYTLIAIDNAGCSDTITFEVLVCNIETMITTKPASAGDIGEIHITATGGAGALTFSLNGSNFVSDTFFTMLEPGEYIVYTMDTAGCIIVDTVTISTQVSTTFVRDEHFIQIHPNPGKGVYHVNSLLTSSEVFIRYTIFTLQGEPVLNGTVAKYNDQHKGEISLMAFPEGIYFAAFYIGNDLVVKRIIKTR